MGLKFIKYNQDEYQRLGLMKILVAILDPQRRSTSSDAINRRMDQLLHFSQDGRAMSLIRDSGSSSWNFPFTAVSVGKILDWGKILGLVGSGNQITERGLLLRYLMGEQALRSINTGDFSINPFNLTILEKLYLLYRHFELDDPLYFLITRLAKEQSNSVVSGIDADKITCLALYDTSKFYGAMQSSRTLLQAKSLKDLIVKMATELRIENEIPLKISLRPKPLSPLKLKSKQKDKKRTKAADHEAIPRFEMLTDLGLLEKRVPEGANSEKARKSWAYWTTPLLSEFASRLPGEFRSNFYWSTFSEAAHVFSGGLQTISLKNDYVAIASRVYDAYLSVKRPFGHTPLESIALVAMIQASARSEIIELDDIHRLFLDLKRKGNLPNIVRFAAGNDLDRMFVDIGATFVEEVGKSYGNPL